MSERPSALRIPSFEDEEVAERFIHHYDSIRGEVRTRILRRHLTEMLDLRSDAPQSVVDVGCGDGRDAIWLARLGHKVLAVDPSPAMAAKAKAKAAEAGVGENLRVEQWDLDQTLEFADGAGYDLVLSHGVMMYADNPSEFLSRHFGLVASSGYVSVLTKNALAQPFRAADDGDFVEALRLIDDSQGAGYLGLLNQSQSAQDLADIAASNSALVHSWAGIRVFSDRGAWDADVVDPEQILRLEWRVALDPIFRGQGALLHFIYRKGLDLTHLPA